MEGVAESPESDNEEERDVARDFTHCCEVCYFAGESFYNGLPVMI